MEITAASSTDRPAGLIFVIPARAFAAFDAANK